MSTNLKFLPIGKVKNKMTLKNCKKRPVDGNVQKRKCHELAEIATNLANPVYKF